MRPTVSVVMPLGGDAPDVDAALATLHGLRLGDGDELILADNGGGAAALGDAHTRPVHVISVAGERSPAHARNAGARAARGEWILFLDADCVAPADLIERYLSEPVDAAVGALVGQVHASLTGADAPLAARYGAARNFLDQRAHLAHPYRPRAAAANLMVRRTAFAQVGGFLEGVRAGEDTDFAWRLQQAGWRLELREAATVEHRYRTSLRELRRQWRGYAAGRAWLSRRYDDFRPEPALSRAARRIARIAPGGPAREPAGPRPGSAARPPDTGRDRYVFAAIDAMLALDELVGFALSNRPAGAPAAASDVVLVAERFPDRDDPFAELAVALRAARVEAARRPRDASAAASPTLEIVYREDDGLLTRVGALLSLAVRRPRAVLRDARRQAPGEPSLLELAPVALRLIKRGERRLRPLGPGRPRAVALRLAALAACETAGHESA